MEGGEDADSRFIPSCELDDWKKSGTLLFSRTSDWWDFARFSRRILREWTEEYRGIWKV